MRDVALESVVMNLRSRGAASGGPVRRQHPAIILMMFFVFLCAIWTVNARCLTLFFFWAEHTVSFHVYLFLYVSGILSGSSVVGHDYCVRTYTCRICIIPACAI